MYWVNYFSREAGKGGKGVRRGLEEWRWGVSTCGRARRAVGGGDGGGGRGG